MDTLHPKSGFASQTSLSGHNPPATPPYTPAKPKHKRRLERSDSPASSIHPAETSSPAKKVLKRTASDSLIVVELPDGEPSSLLDIDIDVEVEVMSPAELEEAEEYILDIESDIDGADSALESDSDSDSGISEQFSKLNCDEQQEEKEMTEARLQRRLSKRSSLRVYKRPHSQSANGDTNITDTDDEDERSGDASIRRLRRRMLSPVGGPVDWEDGRSSPEPTRMLNPIEQKSEQDRKMQRTYASVLKGDCDERVVES